MSPQAADVFLHYFIIQYFFQQRFNTAASLMLSWGAGSHCFLWEATFYKTSEASWFSPQTTLCCLFLSNKWCEPRSLLPPPPTISLVGCPLWLVLLHHTLSKLFILSDEKTEGRHFDQQPIKRDVENKMKTHYSNFIFLTWASCSSSCFLNLSGGSVHDMWLHLSLRCRPEVSFRFSLETHCCVVQVIWAHIL